MFLGYGCTPPASKTTGPGAPFDENLSSYRPQYVAPNYTSSKTDVETPVEIPYVAPSNAIKNELDSVALIMQDKVKHVRKIDGLTIQVYTGNNRDNATSIRRRVSQLSDDLEPKITYNQPNYKVRVGQYFNRVEANKDFTLLKKEFPQALLVPDKILIDNED